jgi:GNAT superfamily N-acetyltransferase
MAATKQGGRMQTEPIALREAGPSDDAWIVARHGAIYAAEEGFDAEFPQLVASILQQFRQNRDAARECGWIAEKGGTPLGCIFCMSDREAGPEVAKLRLFLLEPEARGTGLAQRMIETCLSFARDAGYSEIRLWTHRSHVAAGRLYARNGFVLEREADARAFGVDLVDQFWARAL